MPEKNNDLDNTQAIDETEDSQESQSQETNDDADEEDSEDSDDDGEELDYKALYERAQKDLTKVRKEAAKNRVNKNDAQQENKTLADRVAELEADRTSREKELQAERASSKRLKLAHDYGIPDDAVDLLGEDVDRMEDIAKKLKVLRGSAQSTPPYTPNPRGGVDPSKPGEIPVSDAVSNYLKNARH